MVIGMDLDGVLYDFVTPAYRELVLHHSVTIPFIEFWREADNIFPPEFWKSFLAIECLYSASKALPEDVETLNYLAKNNSIYYVTSRPKNCELATYNWLRREGFPGYNNLFVVQNGKRPILEMIKMDYFIEDRPYHADSVRDLTTVIMKDTPWNQEAKDYKRIKLVSELKEIIK